MRRLGTLALLIPALVVVPVAPATAGTTCDGRPVTISGTDGDDVLDGTPGDDVISGGAGSDVIRGLGGNDVLCGDSDDDQLDGGAGDDVLIGGADRRGKEWGEGHYYWYGDLLVGGDGDDTLVGDEVGGTETYPYGDDTASYEDAAQAVGVRGAWGVVSGQGQDTIEDVTSVVLTAYDDRAVAGGTLTQVDGGPGNDELTTADGFEPPYRWTDTGIDGYLDGGPGSDDVSSRGAHWELLGGDGADRLTAGDKAALRGGAGNDRVTGSPAADSVVIVGRGHDRVATGGGPDRVTLGTRAHGDELRPARVDTGAGDDVVAFETAPADGSVIRLGGGRDHTHFAPYAFETRDAPVPDVTIDAGAGRDLFGSPFLVAVGPRGPVPGEVADLAAGTVRTRGTTSVMTIDHFEDLTGTPWRDVLLGSDGPNTIRGGERADTIRGRGGVDHAIGGSGRDGCDAEITHGCEHSLS